MIGRLAALADKLRLQHALLAENTMRTPPEDWAAFQRAVGRYHALREAEADIRAALRGTEDDI